MAGFCSSVFAKHHGSTLPPFFFCAILLGLVSMSAANNICPQHKNIILKPTNTYSRCNVKIPVVLSRRAPTISYPEAKDATSFNLTTIVMLSPKGRNSVHWLRTNIPKDRLTVGTSNRADDFFKYKGPNPPQDTGEFIYQFYLLSQSLGSNVTIYPYVDNDRKNFKMAEFQKANKMEVLGVYQFRTEFESNSSGRPSFSVILGVISVFWAVFLGA